MNEIRAKENKSLSFVATSSLFSFFSLFSHSLIGQTGLHSFVSALYLLASVLCTFLASNLVLHFDAHKVTRYQKYRFAHAALLFLLALESRQKSKRKILFILNGFISLLLQYELSKEAEPRENYAAHFLEFRSPQQSILLLVSPDFALAFPSVTNGGEKDKKRRNQKFRSSSRVDNKSLFN